MDRGCRYSAKETQFSVFAPKCREIAVAIYEDAHTPYRTEYPMRRGDDAVFRLTLQGDFKNKFYTYLLDRTSEVTDPCSFAASSNSRRSAVVDLAATDPEGWNDPGAHDLGPIAPTQSVIYEAHIRDLTHRAPVRHPDKYLGAAEPFVLDHLSELGVTHIHLLPVFDFATVDETAPCSEEYNWGYDPELFNVPEGSYSTDPDAPEVRIRELKTLILALHRRGIRVVLDVVYNHTYKSFDSNFYALAGTKYYRTAADGSFSNGSGVGNEFATEKPPGRNFLIDSLKFWAGEYRVDGFRFDLMGLYDLETVEAAASALRGLRADILLYGEPWTGGLSVLPEPRRVCKGAQADRGFALFNDMFRDAIRGDNDGYSRGLIQGNLDALTPAQIGVAGSIQYSSSLRGFTSQPEETINYFSCHDNLILRDKLERTLSADERSRGELEKRTKLAFAILMTSQGIPFFAAGTEFSRGKDGRCNTYNAPMSVNAIDWNLKTVHRKLFGYVRDLIRLRREFEVFRLASADEIRRRLVFIEGAQLAYTLRSIDGSFLLCVHNVSGDRLLIPLELVRQNTHGERSRISVQRIFDESGYLDFAIRCGCDDSHYLCVPPLASCVYRITEDTDPC